MKRKNKILKSLPDDDKLLFLSALLDSISLSKKHNSFGPIDECLSSWEETAELYSIPGLSDKAWERFGKLKSRGLIHG